MSIAQGLVAEEQAKDYLQAQGLKWVESNYRCKMGEIDLVMFDRDCLVFVEVKARKNNSYGGALVSIGVQKQRKLIKTASLYLLVKKLHDKHPVRFDVVTIEGVPPKIDWIKNAFGIS